jgi:hypothetical protein
MNYEKADAVTVRLVAGPTKRPIRRRRAVDSDKRLGPAARGSRVFRTTTTGHGLCLTR